MELQKKQSVKDLIRIEHEPTDKEFPKDEHITFYQCFENKKEVWYGTKSKREMRILRAFMTRKNHPRYQEIVFGLIEGNALIKDDKGTILYLSYDIQHKWIIGDGDFARKLAVNVSSTRTEDQDLLHQLLLETRRNLVDT